MSAPHPIRPCAEFPNDNTDLHAGSRWLSAHPVKTATAHLPDAPSVTFEAEPLPALQRRVPVRPLDAPEVSIAVLETHALDAATLKPLELTALELTDIDDPFLAELAPFVEQMECAPFTATDADQTPTQKLRPIAQAVQPLVPLQFELTPMPPDVSEWSQLTALLTEHLLSLGHTRAAALVTPLLNAELVDLSRLDRAVIEQLERDGVACPRGSRMVSTASFRSSAHVFREELANGGLDANEALFWLTQLIGALIGSDDDNDRLEAALRERGVALLLERAA